MPFDLEPVLKGEILELRPLRPGDFHDLYAVASDPLIWEQHPIPDRYKEEVMKIPWPKRPEFEDLAFQNGLEIKGHSLFCAENLEGFGAYRLSSARSCARSRV